MRQCDPARAHCTEHESSPGDSRTAVSSLLIIIDIHSRWSFSLLELLTAIRHEDHAHAVARPTAWPVYAVRRVLYGCVQRILH